MEGMVSNFSTQADAFVWNGDLKKNYQKDCFLQSKVAAEAGLERGDIIIFKVVVTADGRPQAQTPIWVKSYPLDSPGREEQVREATAMGVLGPGLERALNWQEANRRYQQAPEHPFLPERAERLPTPRAGTGKPMSRMYHSGIMDGAGGKDGMKGGGKGLSMGGIMGGGGNNFGMGNNFGGGNNMGNNFGGGNNMSGWGQDNWNSGGFGKDNFKGGGNNFKGGMSDSFKGGMNDNFKGGMNDFRGDNFKGNDFKGGKDSWGDGDNWGSNQGNKGGDNWSNQWNDGGNKGGWQGDKGWNDNWQGNNQNWRGGNNEWGFNNKGPFNNGKDSEWGGKGGKDNWLGGNDMSWDGGSAAKRDADADFVLAQLADLGGRSDMPMKRQKTEGSPASTGVLRFY